MFNISNMPSTSHFDTSQLVEGAEVYTSDGMFLGTVKEMRGNYFKLDVRMSPDYWLVEDVIASITPERVTLSISDAQLDEHKVDMPAALT